ncbi:hypothetical protein TNCV_581141 [Trichonephila clavipes]|nr:hypothetical protein TNCV_581141 [Trichonephila clavipes]
MPLSRMENSTFAMPNIIDSHDMGLRTVYSPDAQKKTPIQRLFNLASYLAPSPSTYLVKYVLVISQALGLLESCSRHYAGVYVTLLVLAKKQKFFGWPKIEFWTELKE